MRREFRWFEFGSLFINGALVVVGIYALWIYNGQLKEMRKATTATQIAATAAQNAVEQAARDNAAAIAAQRDIAKNSSDLSQESFEKSFGATVQQFRQDQRAWLGLADFSVTQFNDKDPFKMRLVFVNTGKTPAIHSEKVIAFQIPSKPFRVAEDLTIPQNALEPAGSIPPQGHFGVDINNTAVPQFYDGLNNGNSFLYFFGEMRYRDVYSQTVHRSTFCVVYDRVLHEMGFCLFGNEMN